MRIAGALAGLLIVALGAWLLLRPPGAPASSRGSAGAGSSGAPLPGAAEPLRDEKNAIHAPLSREEEIRDDLSRKRIPYYRVLRDRFSDVIAHFAVTEMLDTLDLQVNRQDDKTLSYIIENAVGPYARQYGFRRVRFYVPNPPGSSDPVTLIAESTDDGSGRWNTFRK